MATDFTDGAEEQKRSINGEDNNYEANLQVPMETHVLRRSSKNFLRTMVSLMSKKQRILMILKRIMGEENYKNAETDRKRDMLSAALDSLLICPMRKMEKSHHALVGRRRITGFKWIHWYCQDHGRVGY